jgi:hypothetical protein
MTITPDLLGIGAPLRLALRDIIVADAKTLRAARMVSVTQARRFRERTAPSTWVESVR